MELEFYGHPEPICSCANYRSHRSDGSCVSPTSYTTEFWYLALATLCRGSSESNIWDETFADFAPYVSVAPEIDGALFVARSFTKFFAVPGLRLGCLVARDPSRAGLPALVVGQRGRGGGRYRRGEGSGLRRNRARGGGAGRRQLFSALGELSGITAYPGAANFLLVRGPEMLPERLARRGILVRGCEPFCGLGPGYFRVAVRGEKENESCSWGRYGTRSRGRRSGPRPGPRRPPERQERLRRRTRAGLGLPRRALRSDRPYRSRRPGRALRGAQAAKKPDRRRAP
jgi:Aminotransferase class I and II